MLVDYKIIAENIRFFRKGKLTQAELGQKIGRSESSIRKYESGLVEIPNSVIELIADALGIDSIDLYFDRSKQDEHIKNMREAMGLSNTGAAHFDSNEYTEEELEQIKKFAEFVKSQRKHTE